jgi:hypothetical protein
MTKPTARELMDKHEWFGIDGLAVRVQAVLALHVEWHSIDVEPQCDECYRPWPCPTVRMLNGEEP